MTRILTILAFAFTISSVSLASGSGFVEGVEAKEIWTMFTNGSLLKKPVQKGVRQYSEIKKGAECSYTDVSAYQKDVLQCGSVKIVGKRAEELKNILDVKNILTRIGQKSAAVGTVTYYRINGSSCDLGSVEDSADKQYMTCNWIF